MERAVKVDLSLINIYDKDTPINLEIAAEIFKTQFYDDKFEEAEEMLKHIENQLENGKLTNGENKVLSKENRQFIQFMESEEVQTVRHDRELFDYFFQTIADTSSWTSYYDEPTRKVKYKMEDGMNLISCLCEGIVDAPLINVLSLFAEIDLFKDWFPNITEAYVVKPVSPIRGLYSAKQSMPWPIWPRDMTFKASGMFDKKNIGALCVMSSAPESTTYFGTEVPKVADGYVSLDIKRGYHYFQVIDEKTTRYLTIFNTDPKMPMIPNWFMNFMMTKICYQMLEIIQAKAKDVPNLVFGERIRNRPDFYGKIDEEFMKLKEAKDAEKKKKEESGDDINQK